LYLFQKVLRSMSFHNIDHRLRQGDFRDQDRAPLYPSLGGQSIAGQEQQQAVLLVGSDVRHEQPIANHRLRKASLRGASMMVVNPVDFDCNWAVREKIVCAPGAMVAALAGIARALAEADGAADVVARLHDARMSDSHRRIAELLKGAARGSILLGNLAAAHPDGSILRALAQVIARLSGKSLGYLSEGSNAAGAWLAGVLPHRGPAMQRIAEPGMDAVAMLKKRLRAYLLMGVEPDLDTWDGQAATLAVQRAGLVIAFSAFRSPVLEAHAHVLLPIAAFAETAGTFVNAEGTWQSFEAAVSPPDEVRPAWKVLRVLGNALDVAGCDYMQASGVRDELRALVEERVPGSPADVPAGALLYRAPTPGLERITTVPMYSTDMLVRHAAALQATGHVADDQVRVSPSLAVGHGLVDGDSIRVSQQGAPAQVLKLKIDPRLPDSGVLVHGAGPLHNLGPAFGPIKVERA
jgi:NADH-quinone oxidoreductase subunit G